MREAELRGEERIGECVALRPTLPTCFLFYLFLRIVFAGHFFSGEFAIHDFLALEGY